MDAVSWRSLLFVPADDAARCEKAARAGADAVILDLEDGVSVEAKPTARRRVAETVRELATARTTLVVRINGSWRDAVADLEVAVTPGVRAVMVPKTDSAARLTVLAAMIGEFELERRIAPDTIGLLPLIESPAALPALAAFVAVPRVLGLALGPEDFCLELGVTPDPSALDLPSRLLAAAAAPSRMALAVPYSIAAYRDVEGSRRRRAPPRSMV